MLVRAPQGGPDSFNVEGLRGKLPLLCLLLYLVRNTAPAPRRELDESTRVGISDGESHLSFPSEEATETGGGGTATNPIESIPIVRPFCIAYKRSSSCCRSTEEARSSRGMATLSNLLDEHRTHP